MTGSNSGLRKLGEGAEGISDKTIDFVLALVKGKVDRVLEKGHGLNVSSSLHDQKITLEESPDGEKEGSVVLKNVRAALKAVFKTNDVKVVVSGSQVEIVVDEKPFEGPVHLERVSKKFNSGNSTIALPPDVVGKFPEGVFLYYKMEGSLVKCVLSPAEVFLPGYDFAKRSLVSGTKTGDENRLNIGSIVGVRSRGASNVVGMRYSPSHGYVVFEQCLSDESPAKKLLFVHPSAYENEVGLLEKHFGGGEAVEG